MNNVCVHSCFSRAYARRLCTDVYKYTYINNCWLRVMYSSACVCVDAIWWCTFTQPNTAAEAAAAVQCISIKRKSAHSYIFCASIRVVRATTMNSDADDNDDDDNDGVYAGVIVPGMRLSNDMPCTHIRIKEGSKKCTRSFCCCGSHNFVCRQSRWRHRQRH